MVATATCPRCGHTNQLFACQNCGNTDYRLGQLTDGSQGLICKACNMGWSHTYCQGECGTAIPATAFGTPVSRAARRVQEGMEAYQSGTTQSGNCFIASEIYGADSDEVFILRYFRDNFLLSNRIGKILVNLYYRVGPSIISIMRRFSLVRFSLHQMVAMSVFIIQRIIEANSTIRNLTSACTRNGGERDRL
jgi:hypothetical protein